MILITKSVKALMVLTFILTVEMIRSIIIEPSGHFVIWAMVLTDTLIGAATGFAFGVRKELTSNGWNFSEINWGV